MTWADIPVILIGLIIAGLLLYLLHIAAEAEDERRAIERAHRRECQEADKKLADFERRQQSHKR